MASQATEPQLLPIDAGGVSGQVSNQGSGQVHAGYLTMFDLFRVVVCACVLGQHSFLWTGMSTNDIGTGFITVLHFTRNAFFFLSGLVVCYAQLTRPRSIGRFWLRRYVQIGIPFLAWTWIYVLFTILRPGGRWNEWNSYFWSDLRLGYYQLYVVIVLFQFYLVFPFFLKLLKSTSTRQHVVIMSISLAVSLFIGTDLHYAPHIGVIGIYVHDIGSSWVWSRNLISYQVYFVAGVLVAYHFEAVFNFVRRWSRWVLMASAAGGVATVLWYCIVIAQGASLGSASDIFEPIAVIWSLAAIAGVFALSVIWSGRSQATGVSGGPVKVKRAAVVGPEGGRLTRLRVGLGLGLGRLRRPSLTYLAELTGGFYLCHVLFINMIRAALYSGLIGGANFPWPIRTATFYVGTAVVGTTFVSLILHTPLRWVLGGPVRAEQRVRDNAEMAARTALGTGATGRGAESSASTESGVAVTSVAPVAPDRVDLATKG